MTGKREDGGSQIGYNIGINSDSEFYFIIRGSNNTTIYITYPVGIIADGSWHQVILTYNGSSDANGINIYFDSSLISFTTKSNSLNSSIQNSVSFQISGRDGANFCFNGKMDEVLIYDKELTQEEVTYKYNSGIGRETEKYLITKPTIKPSTSWEVSGLSQFFAFNETLGSGNQGNIGYQLSDDDGVNWRYWNGSAWTVTADENNYNSASVVGAHISTFPVTNQKILFKAILISDGTQKVELDTNEITATVGVPPNVYAGTNKSCYDHETKKPFLDATISDPDGDIEQASAWYNIEGSGWIQISKGGYGTLQEAIRNWQYTFDNIGVITCQLKIIDQDSKETVDDLDVTVNKYTVTFNVKDKDGNHLANFQFLPDDGSDWQQENSPFTWDYDYYDSDRDVIFDKVGFQTQHTVVPISVHTENITLNVLGAVSPAEVADAVWDELKSGHTISNSYGKITQDIVGDVWSYATRTLSSFGTLIADIWSYVTRTLTAGTKDTVIDNIKTQTDKIPNIKTETDKIQPEIINKKSEFKANLSTLETLVKRILGLNQENFKLYDCVYSEGHMISGKIKIYPSATDLQNDTNMLANYQITVEYNPESTVNKYEVKKL